MSPCDAYVALSGAGETSGAQAQKMSAKYVCDRGSSHVRYQGQIMSEEYRRWKVSVPPFDSRFIAREEKEYENANAITVHSEFARKTFLECGVPATGSEKTRAPSRQRYFRRMASVDNLVIEVLNAPLWDNSLFAE